MTARTVIRLLWCGLALDTLAVLLMAILVAWAGALAWVAVYLVLFVWFGSVTLFTAGCWDE